MEGGSSVIPESVMDSVQTTLANVEDVRTHLLQFLSLSDPDVLAEMPPLQRAQALFSLAKATATLFTRNFPFSCCFPDWILDVNYYEVIWMLIFTFYL